VPVIPVMEAFPIYYAGGTIKEILYDYRKGEAWFDKFFADFKPDLGWDPVMFFPAQFMELLGLNWFRWPGNQIEEPNAMYQFIEGEYMKQDEYDEATFDPTNFMLTKWMPRSFKHLQGLKKLYFRNSMWLGFLGTFSVFSDPEVVDALERSMKAAKILNGWFEYIAAYRTKMEEQFGIPVAYAGFAFAPFDMVGDTMRGTVEILTDMLERPEKLLALIDKVTEFAIEDQIRNAKPTGRPWVWFWLHKGVDEFMSNAQYARFYWPSLRRYMLALIDAGLTPVIYAEGNYHSRLEHLKDIPKGKVLYDFEGMDMTKAKKALGDRACIAGNLPNTLLSFGKKHEVVDATKHLIDTCASGGGFMLDTSALIDDAKPENVMAMFETARTYGCRR
jgi:uroporphyrinogen-III decarboxylase